MAEARVYELNRLIAFSMTGILLGLILVLSLHMGGSLPELPTLSGASDTKTKAMIKADIDPLFSLNTTSNLFHAGHLDNPFFTDYFVPSKPAPPAPPTTRNVKLFFHGFYESANGKRLVYIKVDDALKIFEVGAAVTGNYVLREVELDFAVIVNGENDLVQLPFDKSTTVKVPIQ